MLEAPSVIGKQVHKLDSFHQVRHVQVDDELSSVASNPLRCSLGRLEHVVLVHGEDEARLCLTELLVEIIYGQVKVAEVHNSSQKCHCVEDESVLVEIEEIKSSDVSFLEPLVEQSLGKLILQFIRK